MRLNELNTISTQLVEPKYGFVLTITEDNVTKETKFELLHENVLKTAASTTIKTDPFLMGFASYWTTNAIQAYQKNRKYSTALFAKTPSDRMLYAKIVDDLMKTGNYTKIRDTAVDGGRLYQLVWNN